MATEEEVVEEEWKNADGSNVFAEEKFQVSKIDNLFAADAEATASLVFESYATQQMTPLDMTYDESNKDNDDEFYDGTGSLVWLASIAFCHLVAQDLIPKLAVTRKDETEDQRICELGCGVGLASIATLRTSLSKRSIKRLRRAISSPLLKYERLREAFR